MTASPKSSCVASSMLEALRFLVMVRPICFARLKSAVGILVALVIAVRGMRRVCPGDTGLISNTATPSGKSAITCEGIFPVTIFLKMEPCPSSAVVSRSSLCLTSSSNASGESASICL